MSVADKLLQVNQVKQDIKTAIETKGVPMTNVAFTEYANKILDISGGGGEVDEYFYYAKAYYTITNNSTLFANAWQDMEYSETVLFDIPLTLAAPNQEMEGFNIDLYVGTNGQLQALYDACVNETIPPPINSDNTDVYYVNNVATYYMGDVSILFDFPVPLYQFGSFNEFDNTSFIITDITPLGMGLGLVLAKFAGVSILNNNIVIQQGFEFENESGIIIPNSVTSIGSSAFYNWSANNKPLVIPESVTSIEYGAFENWNSNNQPLVIPNSVTSIGEVAFEGWQLVPYVEIQAITPPTLAHTDAFDSQGNAPIYVPDESVDDYKTATQWVDLANRIFSINDLASGGGGGGGITKNTVSIPFTEAMSQTQTTIEVTYNYVGDDPVDYTADFSNFTLGNGLTLNMGEGSIPISMVMQTAFGKTTLNYFEIIILFRYLISATVMRAIHLDNNSSPALVLRKYTDDYKESLPNVFEGINDVNINGATFTVDFIAQCQDIPFFNTVTGRGSDMSVTVETVGDLGGIIYTDGVEDTYLTSAWNMLVADNALDAQTLGYFREIGGMTLKLYPSIKMKPNYIGGMFVD